jgi:hypothetical protein
MMKYSAPIAKILERELARIEGKNQTGPTRLVGEIGRLHAAVQSLEGVALNRSPADTAMLHAKKTGDAGVRLAKAVEATRNRANEILNENSGNLREKMLDASGLRPPGDLPGIMRQQELRAVVRSMSQKMRNEVLLEAVKAKDAETLSALFNASPLASGLDPEFMRKMRHTYESTVAPDLVEELDALIEADHALQAAARVADKVAADSQDEPAMQAFVRAEEAAERARESFSSAIQE